jgi:hypothetical protein
VGVLPWELGNYRGFSGRGSGRDQGRGIVGVGILVWGIGHITHGFGGFLGVPFLGLVRGLWPGSGWVRAGSNFIRLMRVTIVFLLNSPEKSSELCVKDLSLMSGETI